MMVFKNVLKIYNQLFNAMFMNTFYVKQILYNLHEWCGLGLFFLLYYTSLSQLNLDNTQIDEDKKKIQLLKKLRVHIEIQGPTN